MVFVKPSGPHHCAACSGLVHASKTSPRGASKSRVVTISRSEVVAASLLFAAILVFLFSPVLRHSSVPRKKAGEVAGPPGASLLETF
jgi:hypothetical protein